jgi:hypothetical protein
MATIFGSFQRVAAIQKLSAILFFDGTIRTQEITDVVFTTTFARVPLCAPSCDHVWNPDAILVPLSENPSAFSKSVNPRTKLRETPRCYDSIGESS